MRVRCLFGLHEMVAHGRVEPPPGWNDAPAPDWIEMQDWRGRTVRDPWRGFPVFVLTQCRHCPHTDYDMEFPDARN